MINKQRRGTESCKAQSRSLAGGDMLAGSRRRLPGRSWEEPVWGQLPVCRGWEWAFGQFYGLKQRNRALVCRFPQLPSPLLPCCPQNQTPEQQGPAGGSQPATLRSRLFAPSFCLHSWNSLQPPWGPAAEGQGLELPSASPTPRAGPGLLEARAGWRHIVLTPSG